MVWLYFKRILFFIYIQKNVYNKMYEIYIRKYNKIRLTHKSCICNYVEQGFRCFHISSNYYDRKNSIDHSMKDPKKLCTKVNVLCLFFVSISPFKTILVISNLCNKQATLSNVTNNMTE